MKMEQKVIEIPSKLDETIVLSLIKIEEEKQDVIEEPKKKDEKPFIHPPPRLFRKSLFYKTKKLFNMDFLFAEKKVIRKPRPLRDK